jgi:hypothetical protein
VTPVAWLLRSVTDRPILRQLLGPVVLFGGVATAGTIGFVAATGVGVVEAVFWLLDPTSIELYFQHHDGPATLVKGYAIVVLSGLVLAGLWAGETAVSAAFGGQIHEEITQMKIQQEIAECTDHVIVCGYGTFGKTVAAEHDGTVVVVERQPKLYEQAVEDGHLAVEGDAREGEVLRRAGVERADTVVGAVDDTNVNAQLAVTASQIAPTVSLVLRAGDQMDEALARRVGADEVVIPERASARAVGDGL